MLSVPPNSLGVQPPARPPIPVRTPYDFFFTAHAAGLLPSARAVWLAIHECECESIPPVSVLAQRAGVGRRQCKRLLFLLRSNGFLERKSDGRCRRTIPPVSPVTPLPGPPGVITDTDAWTACFERTFKRPSHVWYKPHKRMGADALLEVGLKVQEFVAASNHGKAPGISVVQQKLRDGSTWPHLHMIVDAHRVSFTGFAHAREGELACRRIGKQDSGLEYIAKKLSAGEPFEKLPGTWLRWGETESAGRLG